jgi:Reversibly glycosylated polypeptide
MKSGQTCAVVVTTIGQGNFLDDYFTAASAEGVLDRTTFYVIPDRKTPTSLFDRSNELASRGMRIVCPSVEEQDLYLNKLGIKELIPYDSDNRRNVGYLLALESGCDFTISIDDDNYCRVGEPFFSEHAVVASGPVTAPSVESSSGWFNICDLLKLDKTGIYPRGFPYAKRHDTPTISQNIEAGRVALNAGLWLSEPDLDAMTWLVSPCRASGLRREAVLLGKHAWSPINTQNTALHRDVLVSYYFAKMGYPLAGLVAIDRFGDILSGYLCQSVIRHLGDRIRVGTPAVDHRRNSHNYMKDATCEMGGVWLMEDLCAWLTELKLNGSSYHDAYVCLAHALDEQAERFSGFIWTDATRGYVHQLAHCMRRWAQTCARWLSLSSVSVRSAA